MTLVNKMIEFLIKTNLELIIIYDDFFEKRYHLW